MRIFKAGGGRTMATQVSHRLGLPLWTTTLRNAPRVQHRFGRLRLITTCCVAAMAKATQPSGATDPKKVTPPCKTLRVFFCCNTHVIPTDLPAGRCTRPRAKRDVVRRNETRAAYRIHWLTCAISVEQIGERRAAVEQVSAHLQRGRRAYNGLAGIT